MDGLCADLDAADNEGATRHGAGIADPLVSFYETFLEAYDSQLRERAGVYYTPDAVVDFIVRVVDDVLRSSFGKTTDSQMIQSASWTLRPAQRHF